MTIENPTSPLLAARTTVAAAITAATGYEVLDGARVNIATPVVVLEPNGWALTGAGGKTVAYTLHVTCLYNAAEAALPGAEEMARKVFLALLKAGWVTPEVPPPSGISYGDRPFTGVQFTTGTTLTLE